MNPNIWGPYLWFFIHTLCLEYSDNPNENDRRKIKQFFLNLGTIIPCEQCSEHYSQNLSSISNIDNALTDSNSLFNWSVELHNSVNKMLGKKTWTNEEAMSYYKNIYEKKQMYSYSNLNNFINSCPELHNNKHNKNKSVFNFLSGTTIIFLIIGMIGGYLLCNHLNSNSKPRRITRKMKR